MEFQLKNIPLWRGLGGGKRYSIHKFLPLTPSRGGYNNSFFVFFFILLFPNPIHAQKDLAKQLSSAYDNYKESTITNRRFKHQDIVPLIKKRKSNPIFETSVLGQSVKGRDIYLVKMGNGPTKVLLWSQMHGDEPTATMAMMDIFNFFANEKDKFGRFKNNLLNELTLYFVPLLNPDGAELYQRRNAMDIDLNRDALRTSTPEGKILKKIRDQTDADFGFNLHDQSIYYSAGLSPSPATISFLAPAFNYEKEINETRKRAMQLIVRMNEVIQERLPEHVAKYSDNFEPRAFGDNIQKWGTSTILIEAGGLRGDPEKQAIRKLHFIMLLDAFNSIANQSYLQKSTDDYFAIPDNERQLVDLMIRNVSATKEGKSYQTDIAFKRTEINTKDASDFYYRSYINDLGDLSIYYGYEELNAQGYRVVPGKSYKEIFASSDEVRSLDLMRFLREGYTDFYVKEIIDKDNLQKILARIHLEGTMISNELNLRSNPSILLERQGRFRYAIINGLLYDLKEDSRD